MKNVFVKNTFLKTSDVNTTTALSTYSTPHPLSTSQKNEIYCFDSLNYCLQHWAAVWLWITADSDYWTDMWSLNY